MKNYFLRLFNYDYAMNVKMLGLITQSAQTGNAVKLMSHLLAAQQIWLSRCIAKPNPDLILWPDWDLESLSAIAKNNFEAWQQFLTEIKNEDFEKPINYQNSRGGKFQNTLSDVLTHLINHGTHHRAQVGQQLKLNADIALPSTDYIFYIRENQL